MARNLSIRSVDEEMLLGENKYESRFTKKENIREIKFGVLTGKLLNRKAANFYSISDEMSEVIESIIISKQDTSLMTTLDDHNYYIVKIFSQNHIFYPREEMLEELLTIQRKYNKAYKTMIDMNVTEDKFKDFILSNPEDQNEINIMLEARLIHKNKINLEKMISAFKIIMKRAETEDNLAMANIRVEEEGVI